LVTIPRKIFFELLRNRLTKFLVGWRDADGSAGGFSETGCTSAEPTKDPIS
jgi:hypothetical protein